MSLSFGFLTYRSQHIPKYFLSNVFAHLNFSLINIKEWQKHNKDKVKDLKYRIRKGGTKAELKPLHRELQNRETYIANLAKYLDSGVWLDLFYGKDQEKQMKWKTLARAYDAAGYLKTNIPAVG